jgi:hypothetical protein
MDKDNQIEDQDLDVLEKFKRDSLRRLTEAETLRTQHRGLQPDYEIIDISENRPSTSESLEVDFELVPGETIFEPQTEALHRQHLRELHATLGPPNASRRVFESPTLENFPSAEIADQVLLNNSSSQLTPVVHDLQHALVIYQQQLQAPLSPLDCYCLGRVEGFDVDVNDLVQPALQKNIEVQLGIHLNRGNAQVCLESFLKTPRERWTPVVGMQVRVQPKLEKCPGGFGYHGGAEVTNDTFRLGVEIGQTEGKSYVTTEILKDVRLGDDCEFSMGFGFCERSIGVVLSRLVKVQGWPYLIVRAKNQSLLENRLKCQLGNRFYVPEEPNDLSNVTPTSSTLFATLFPPSMTSSVTDGSLVRVVNASTLFLFSPGVLITVITLLSIIVAIDYICIVYGLSNTPNLTKMEYGGFQLRRLVYLNFLPTMIFFSYAFALVNVIHNLFKKRAVHSKWLLFQKYSLKAHSENAMMTLQEKEQLDGIFSGVTWLIFLMYIFLLRRKIVLLVQQSTPHVLVLAGLGVITIFSIRLLFLSWATSPSSNVRLSKKN